MTRSDVTLLVPMLLPVLLVIGLLVIFAVLAYLRRRARQQAWSELAARTGLTFEPGGLFSPMRITGAYRGHALTLDTFTRSSGKSSTTYTRIRLSVNNPSALSLAIYDENVLSKVGKALGMQDIQVGDDELDRRFTFKGQPEPVITGLLTSIGLRQKLLEARSMHVEVKGQEVYWQQRGEESNADNLQFLFDLLSDLAEAVDRAGGGAPAAWG
jgi:hypothetical protein